MSRAQGDGVIDMGEAKRRRSIVAEKRTLSIADMRIAGVACAWDGCSAHFDGEMPPGWTWLISYHDKVPTISDWTGEDWAYRPYHDWALCPAHTRELMLLFKGVHALTDREPEGSA